MIDDERSELVMRLATLERELEEARDTIRQLSAAVNQQAVFRATADARLAAVVGELDRLECLPNLGIAECAQGVVAIIRAALSAPAEPKEEP